MEFSSITPSVNLEKENTSNQLAAYKGAVVSQQEIDRILAPVDTGDLSTITHFGESVANGVSRASDIVLDNTNLVQLDKTSTLMNSLSKIMSSFDLDEIKEDAPKGLFSKLFGDAKKHLEKILAKYTTVGDELEKVYIELRSYESEIEVTNRNLENIFNETVEYYKELLKYIAAGDEGVKMIDAEIAKTQGLIENGGDVSLTFQVTSLQNAKNVLEQRVFDLKTAETAALQSIPMLKTLAYTNAVLNRKIGSTFIVMLPIFKQAIAEAIVARRQQIQAESLKALDEKTNELFQKNAELAVNNAKLATQLSGSSAIKVDTLEKSWRTIMDGLDEQARLTAELSSQREADQKRLQALNNEYFSKAKNN